ncbi:MAG: carboxypeptidase-like regulatory domain-containing protein [Candidatus Electrothrix aestuarii]|uniref:Carboxypeptidase-like regulatory domain-containing protein n=1 Tax=Candidatus Electrothrix aestuarii TaxID=3062594 RepID=A0AAU8M0J6_9BACT|nr:carboxypeptidase-like regulatory domain-containing protein [Candidatus Electrothrix aestuarii]
MKYCFISYLLVSLFFPFFTLLTPSITTAQQSEKDTVISGRVMQSENSSPVQGALVSATDAQGYTRVVETEGNGNYSMDSLTPQKYSVTASADGYIEVAKEIILSAAEHKTDLDFSLSKWGSISGAVFKEDGKTPVVDVLVFATSDNGKMSTARTGGNGRFRIDHVFNDTYSVTVVHDQYAFSEKQVAIQNGLDFTGLKLTALPGKIYGTVKDKTTGRAIHHAELTARRTNIEIDRITQPIQITVSSEKDGSYVIEGLGTGKFNVQVVGKGFGTVVENITLQKGQLQVKRDFELSAGGAVSGHITGRSSREPFEVSMIDPNGNLLKPEQVAVHSDSTYIVKGLASGYYTIMYKQGDALSVRRDISVSAGKITEGIDLVIEKHAGSISGHVYSTPNNQPISGAIIIAGSDTSGNYSTSGNDGSYTINGLAPGLYDLTVTHHQEIKKDKVRIEKNKPAETIDFTMTAK